MVTPRNSIEAQLASIWQQLLGLQRVGVKDNFFELGGHSLLTVRLAAEIERVLHKRFRVMAVFEYPTIEQLATVIQGQVE